MKTVILLLGCLALALLLADNRLLFVNLMRGTADSALALLMPFLVFSASLVTLTSHATAAGLAGLALILQGIKTADDGAFGDVLSLAILGVMLAFFVLSVLAARPEFPGED